MWKTERYFNNTAVLFFVTDEEGKMINASDAMKRRNSMTNSDMKDKLNITLASPIAGMSSLVPNMYTAQ